MHKPLKIGCWTFEYPFRAHALTHHAIFGHDRSYILDTHKGDEQGEHKNTIPMAWWNGPLLIILATLPFIITFGLIFSMWLFVASIALGITLYYGAYEYLHWCMHLPKDRWFEGTYIFGWINNHHNLHHRHPRKNFNVVLPLADLCLFTLVP